MREPLFHRGDRNGAVSAHLGDPLAPEKGIHATHFVPPAHEVQRERPPEVSVDAADQNTHRFSLSHPARRSRGVVNALPRPRPASACGKAIVVVVAIATGTTTSEAKCVRGGCRIPGTRNDGDPLPPRLEPTMFPSGPLASDYCAGPVGRRSSRPCTANPSLPCFPSDSRHLVASPPLLAREIVGPRILAGEGAW